MQLSNLTLFGFKSFVERLSIDFQPGLIAIVGPNGCGKSNIVDAMRWVLGEQRPKALRGERMEDVIFVGNAHRKPVGMAEVSLTLSNIEGRLPIPHDEVTITRRLYRSGESEYLLNRHVCRLKDITRLFLDSGLGREPYALIQQGVIGSFLNARPAERRALLEEAAGTMSYKVNRNTALGRLEAAEQNLLRVRDVLQEIERQRASLHRQAKKAERHQRMTARLHEIEALVLLAADRRLEAELAQVLEQEGQRTGAIEACRLRIAQEETSLESGRLQDLDLENRITAAHERLYGLRSQRSRQEAESQSREELLRDLRRRAEERQSELRAVAERLHRLRGDLEADATTRRATDEALVVVTHELRELSDALSYRETGLREQADALEKRKEELVAAVDRLVGHRNHVASLTERQRLLRQDRESLQRQLAASRTEADTLTTRDGELTRRLDELTARIASLTGERAALTEELTGLAARQEALGEQRAALRGDLRELEGRLHSLRELEEGLAGLSEGPQFLLKGKAAGVAVCQAINGPLSRMLRVDVACERAIEALLGDLQQGLIVPTAETGVSLIRYLEQEGRGWATLLPRQVERAGESPQASLLEQALAAAHAALDPDLAQRVVGPALNFVKAPDELQPLLRSLLADAIIVQDLPTALALLRRLPGAVRVATVAGAVLSSRGPMQGGTTFAVSLLSRRRELEELPLLIARVTEELQAVEIEWEKVQDTRAERQHASSLREESLTADTEARHPVERALAEVRTVSSRLGSQTGLLHAELDRLDVELGDLDIALNQAQQTLQTCTRQEEELKQDTAAQARRVSLLQAEQQELQQALAEARIRSTSLEERKEGLVRSMERLAADLDRERAREADLGREADEDRSREAALAQEMTALQQSLGSLQGHEAQEAGALQNLQGERDRLRQVLLTHEEALKALRRELAELQQEQAATASRRAALSTERSLLQRRLQEHAPEGKPLEALDTEDAPADPETLAHETEELRQKLAGLGPINMAALEEYEALTERFRFMTTQAEDLTSSVNSLKATIAEIKQTIEELFGKTLAAVNQHLDLYWQRLFDGGEAALVLSEGDDTGEPGVDIRVRIPGKRTTTLSLLSGGEKTLGAIAFLMALWATRPSPFIVLDEVDAALDDVNVDRFTALLRELALTSQVIVITHHPRTIEVADLLYGITMEEPGLSKLISVRLGKPADQPVPATAS